MVKTIFKITGLTILAVGTAILSSKVQGKLIEEIFNSLENKVNKS